MTRNLGRRFAVLVPLVCLTVWTLSTRSPATAQSGARSGVGEWRSYGADLANTRYSPLDQINADNFKKLEVAWRFKTDNLGPRPEFNSQSTPLDGERRLYSTAGTRRAVVALDAATGETAVDVPRRRRASAASARRASSPGAASRTGPTAREERSST